MEERPVIQNARGIAQQVAYYIFNSSWFDRVRGEEVKDVLLFGSTLRDNPHDIDMLIIHTLPVLDGFGKITKYDEKTGRMVADDEVKIEDERYNAEAILEAMGSPLFEDFYEERESIERSVKKASWETKKWPIKGEFIVDGVGKVKVRAKDPMEFYTTIMTEADKTLRRNMVAGKVGWYLGYCGLAINDRTLDLQVMNQDLLVPEKGQEDREIAIKQCRDPLFWHTVLTTGRLYDRHAGEFSPKFTIPVEAKYPHAAELFTPK
ncbi:hypothetical protein HY638_01380 [Candidatus Woesearchaeota archaeon]|nr:hypothetical protein [Candidatus Woesearchaeota archaeon]